MFDRIRTLLLGKRSISTEQDLQEFIESRAAFLVQKSITEYAQARANMMFSTLLGEKGFKDAYESARWRSYPAGLSMVCEMALAELRKREGDPHQMATMLTGLAGNIVARFPLPAGQPDRFWATALSAVEADLARAAMGSPHEVHAIVNPRANEIFDALPFHASIRSHDFPMFRNTLAFHLTEIAGELEEMEISSALTG
jgi:hypothetical protein